MFLNNPKVTIYYDIKNKQTKVITHEPLFFDIEKDLITVPINFISDGASIPSLFWQIVGHPLSGQNIRPALMHDYECKLAQELRDKGIKYKYSWQEVHERFKQALIRCGVPGWKAASMKKAVYGNWLLHRNLQW